MNSNPTKAGLFFRQGGGMHYPDYYGWFMPQYAAGALRTDYSSQSGGGFKLKGLFKRAGPSVAAKSTKGTNSIKTQLSKLKLKPETVDKIKSNLKSAGAVVGDIGAQAGIGALSSALAEAGIDVNPDQLSALANEGNLGQGLKSLAIDTASATAQKMAQDAATKAVQQLAGISQGIGQAINQGVSGLEQQANQRLSALTQSLIPQLNLGGTICKTWTIPATPGQGDLCRAKGYDGYNNTTGDCTKIPQGEQCRALGCSGYHPTGKTCFTFKPSQQSQQLTEEPELEPIGSFSDISTLQAFSEDCKTKGGVFNFKDGNCVIEYW